MCLQELGQLESYLLQEQFQKRAVVKTSWDACAPYRSLCSQSQLLAKAPPGGSRDGSRAASHRFDIYRKVPKDLTQPTYTGAIISICCCLFILFLFLSELTGFITTEVVNELYVDDPDKDSGGKIDVSLNLSLPNLHCELVGLDIQDEMGRHEVGHIDNSMKIPLNNGAGCRFEGQFSINKVPGNFHVSTHSATAQPQNPDMTHVIHKLSFGDTLQVQNVHGAFNALGGADRLTSNPLASHDYILKIVPTVYEDKSGKQRYSYQYTVANKVCWWCSRQAVCSCALCWPRAEVPGGCSSAVPFRKLPGGPCPAGLCLQAKTGDPIPAISQGEASNHRQNGICLRRSRQGGFPAGPIGCRPAHSDPQLVSTQQHSLGRSTRPKSQGSGSHQDDCCSVDWQRGPNPAPALRVMEKCQASVSTRAGPGPME
uniref:Endoplasmic reticulum-Golgi intermediate compartment protein n=1 Tax=Oryctolagus cuniculus TaxID=9986 RepID=A0A5F9DPN6_RABIT